MFLLRVGPQKGLPIGWIMVLHGILTGEWVAEKKGLPSSHCR